MLIPVEAVTSNSRRVTRVAMIHRQMQRHHAVTTICVRKRVRKGIRTGSNIRMLIPVEAVTSNSRRVTRVAVIHGQVQGHHTITS